MLTLYLTEPVRNLTSVRRFNRIFNMTATFHLHSDILPYYLANSKFHWSPNEEFSLKSLYRFKTGSAAIISSNTSRWAHNFENYVKKLNTFVPVKIFIDCSRKCLTKAYKNYKFLLIYDPATKCRDYVTNIFLDAFIYDTIPVVFNRLAYDYFVPKSAFIRAYEFNTPEKLGSYLKSLEANETAAKKFFTWKKHVVFDEKAIGNFCDICIKALLEKSPIRNVIVNDMESALRC